MNNAVSTNEVNEFNIHPNEEQKQTKLKTNELIRNVHKSFTEANGINDLLEYIEMIQKELPSKIIEYMSYKDLEFLN